MTNRGLEIDEIAPLNDLPDIGEVPKIHDVLPDGTEVLIEGDVERWAQVGHPQGQNSLGFEGTCGLVSCEEILRMTGVNVDEDIVVRYAAEHRLCVITDDPAKSGGTSPVERIECLRDLGAPAHIEDYTTIEDIAVFVEEGRGVIARVNAGVLWNDVSAYDNGQPNHAVVVTGVARELDTGEVKGIYINDSGADKMGQYVDRKIFENACPGFLTIVSDVTCV